ncbi:DUF805 domain-containing protein [Rhizobium sp. CIAT894]|uniref:DUF805 domain-containing protein n=1 Tax=Rhizobium sp. CIAT894 TaxID=2020312 RepID=UPI000A1D92AE|nr:DUF805 domain-containing protein [Rhizobium sp. CIAT894]
MSFSEAVRTVLTQKYATFSGRATRSEYWWFMLFCLLVLLAIGTLAGAIIMSGAATPAEAFVVIGGLFVLTILLPLMSLQVRRSHDRNISGWWYLALVICKFIPYLGLVAVLVIVVISMLPGTTDSNKFGPDPLRPELRAEVFA